MRPAVLAHAAGALAAVALALGVALPLAALAGRTLDVAAIATWADADVWWMVGRTTLQAAASTAAAVVLGLPAAWALARPDLPLRGFWRALFVVPFVLPSLVAGVAVLAWVGPRGLLGIDGRDTWWVLVLAHAFYNAGLVARIVGGHLAGAGAHACATPRPCSAPAPGDVSSASPCRPRRRRSWPRRR